MILIRRENEQIHNQYLQISDDEIDHIYRKFAESHRQKLLGYYQLKSMLGPLIEGIILLDRLQWLIEQVWISILALLRSKIKKYRQNHVILPLLSLYPPWSVSNKSGCTFKINYGLLYLLDSEWWTFVQISKNLKDF